MNYANIQITKRQCPVIKFIHEHPHRYLVQFFLLKYFQVVGKWCRLWNCWSTCNYLKHLILYPWERAPYRTEIEYFLNTHRRSTLARFEMNWVKTFSINIWKSHIWPILAHRTWLDNSVSCNEFTPVEYTTFGRDRVLDDYFIVTYCNEASGGVLLMVRSFFNPLNVRQLKQKCYGLT